MAGRKVFTSGEILTSADVNSFLMDQSVMVFDDATARTTAIPTPVEGMVTYLKDQDEVTVFDGSAFKAVGPGKIVGSAFASKTDAQTFSSVASGAFETVSDLTINYACQDAANKVLLFPTLSSSNNSSLASAFKVQAGGTDVLIGDASSSRSRVNFGGAPYSGDFLNTASGVLEHSPGTTSSVAYTVEVVNTQTNAQFVFVNRSVNDPNSSRGYRGSSTFLLLEVTA